MAPHLVLLAVGLVVLVKSADYLVEYSARIARRFDVSDLVVGLVITSVGTSLPELASSVSAAFAGSAGIVIGNVVGSNIANIGLVLGVAVLVKPFATQARMHDRDGYILLASALVVFVLALDNRITRLEAALFLAVYVAYVSFAARSDQDEMEHRFRDFLKYFFDFEYAAPVARRLSQRRARGKVEPATRERASGGRLWIDAAIVAASLIALIVGARFVVAEAVWIAERLDVPESLVALSLIAIGTSLPELFVSIAAARKGKGELIIGNVMGSNIANTLLIVGLSAVIHPLDVAEISVVYTIPMMLFFTLALLYFVRSDWRIGRGQGAVAVAAYAAFMSMAFSLGWG